jgi:hypothetical protein
MTNNQAVVLGVLIGAVFAYGTSLVSYQAAAERKPALAVAFHTVPRPPITDIRLWVAAELAELGLHTSPARIRAFITNRGKRYVTLPLPCDGSWDGWRTPFVGWSVVRADDPKAVHSLPPTQGWFRKCGNLDPIRSDDIVTLQPGETREIDVRQVSESGRYRILFFYRNDPTLAVVSDLSSCLPEVKQAIKRSTPCALVSNELKVTVHSPEFVDAQRKALSERMRREWTAFNKRTEKEKK